MTIAEIYARVRVDLGLHQYTTSEIESYIMNTTDFITLVTSTLSVINDYNPILKYNTVPIIQGRHIYESDIPDEIKEAIPITIFSRLNRMAFFALVMSPELSQMGSDLNYNKYAVGGSTLDYKVPVPHLYNKPTLYVFYDGDVSVTQLHNYSITATIADPTLYEVQLLTANNNEFFKLLEARFYIAVGRARRQFIIKDSPVVLDADLMVTEGTAMEQEAMNMLSDKSHWWDAIR
jgi:hypothetical protein